MATAPHEVTANYDFMAVDQAQAPGAPPPDAPGNPFLPAEYTTNSGSAPGEAAPTGTTSGSAPAESAPAPAAPAAPDPGASTTTTVTTTEGTHTPSNLPEDLSVEESDGSMWGGEKPDFLGNLPEDGPEATEWTVTDEQLVEGRMASLMDDDNPVFASLREQVQRAHAARGGKNSLMATRAAYTMMADMAFKIASQDAATMARSAEFNAAMKNQFGLAEQQFIHNALLSDQNFRQGTMMLREQHKTRLAEIDRQVKGQLAAINAQGSWNSRLEAQRHGNVLEQMDAQFENNWMLNEQGQAHSLERMDRETDNLIRRDDFNYQAQDYAADQQLNRQLQLQYMTETGATQRQLLDTLGMIRSNPNLTPQQAAQATNDALATYNAMNQQLQAFYTGGGPPGGGGGSGTYESSSGAFQYNPTTYDYLSYGRGGYTPYLPPNSDFFTETPGAMYGSNDPYIPGMPPSTQRPGNGHRGAPPSSAPPTPAPNPLPPVGVPPPPSTAPGAGNGGIGPPGNTIIQSQPGSP